jgi:hypothetical protein
LGVINLSANPSPEASYAVSVQSGFIADDGYILGLGLGNKHAIERILVRTGQESSANAMVGRNAQNFETFAFDVTRKV